MPFPLRHFGLRQFRTYGEILGFVLAWIVSLLVALDGVPVERKERHLDSFASISDVPRVAPSME